MIETADTAIRLLAIGAQLMMLTVLVMTNVRRELRIPLTGLLIGAAGYLINSSTQMDVRGTWAPWIDLISISPPFWTWLFARRLFEREPAPPILLPLIALLLAFWMIANFIPAMWAVGFYALHFVSLALIADLVWVAFSGRNDDLVEKRRLIRLWLPLLIGFQAGGILIFEVIIGNAITIPIVQAINAGLILALTLFGGIALLQSDAELLVETEGAARHEPDPSEFTPSEQVLHDKLTDAMNAGFYRTPGLTIAGLADHLGAPEHRLRALINRRLGYRNFSAFLNRHRIAEARVILSDREHVDLPVLTIAMDLGYNSLPTFNRAFRSETATTPSDYRREMLSQSAAQN